MRKIYKQLTQEQLSRGVIFSSCLSVSKVIEQEGDNIHEVLSTDEDKNRKIRLLTEDSFFNASIWKYNIIRS